MTDWKSIGDEKPTDIGADYLINLKIDGLVYAKDIRAAKLVSFKGVAMFYVQFVGLVPFCEVDYWMMTDEKHNAHPA